MQVKLSEKDLLELSSDPLKVFYNSIKSHHTKRVYERNLKEFLSVVLSDVLKGTFEQRAKQFADLGKSDPAKLSQILHAYSMVLKKKTSQI